MNSELFQLYDTDVWGSHSSRSNLGIFSSISEALKQLCSKPDRLIYIFKNENRLFVEKIDIDEFEGYSQVFDSESDDNLDLLKRIIFFEGIEKFRANLGFLEVDIDEDIDFDINSIESYEDVSDDLIEEYLNEDNVIKFIKANLIYIY